MKLTFFVDPSSVIITIYTYSLFYAWEQRIFFQEMHDFYTLYPKIRWLMWQMEIWRRKVRHSASQISPLAVAIFLRPGRFGFFCWQSKKISLHIYVILYNVNFFSVDKHILELIPFDNEICMNSNKIQKYNFP